jgi:hypothetical protein
MQTLTMVGGLEEGTVGAERHAVKPPSLRDYRAALHPNPTKPGPELLAGVDECHCAAVVAPVERIVRSAVKEAEAKSTPLHLVKGLREPGENCLRQFLLFDSLNRLWPDPRRTRRSHSEHVAYSRQDELPNTAPKLPVLS